jgi:regulator of sigma E protease
MHDLLRTIVAYVLILGVLVFIHEFGHYLAARWRGAAVDTFSIGFGPALFRWHDRTGTEWRVSALPLGGYVKVHGFEGPEDATPEQIAAWIPGKTFHDKPVGSRAIVIAAGPVFNFLFAILIFAALYSFVGRPEVHNEVGEIVADSAAARAGLHPGDVITRIGDQSVRDYDTLRTDVSAMAGAHTTITVRRGEQTVSMPLVVDSVAGPGSTKIGQLGVLFDASMGPRLSPPRAFVAGAQETWRLSVQTLVGLKQIIFGQRSVKEIGGTIRIAQVSGQVAKLGWTTIVSFLALMSINLGLMNLIPIPILDGGRLLFYGIEALSGRPVPRRVQEISFQAGFALIACLFALTTVNDLASLGLFHWLGRGIG